MSQRAASGISSFYNRVLGKPNYNVWGTRSNGDDDDLEEKMLETFCQTLSGYVRGYSYVAEPTPNTFTSKVPVKLNKDTYLHVTKVT